VNSAGSPAPPAAARGPRGFVTAPTLVRLAAPAVVAVIFLCVWEAWVTIREIPEYVLPGPRRIAAAFADDATWERLRGAWAVTSKTACAALLLAAGGGVLLATALTASRLAEISLFPYAVLLQVTPMVAMAPLIVIWVGVENTERIWLVCAWIVAFFPILANTAMGLRSVDPKLRDLFDLYRSTRWQRFWRLLVPSALPFFLAGLKVSANLAMVGAVVAEFVTGASTEPQGLATVLFEAQYRQDMPLMFAALALISLTGIALYYATQVLGYLLLRRWHASHAERA
jgi:NitT/TauT family transport system permease protein